jgi:hypothetical protein
MMKTSMLQSYQGPSDPMLRSNAIEGYTQVSRVGEQVINCFGTQPRSECPPLSSNHAFRSMLTAVCPPMLARS